MDAMNRQKRIASHIADPPTDGWPDRPAGEPSECKRIADWLLPHGTRRSPTYLMANSAEAARWVHTVATSLLNELHDNSRSPPQSDEIQWLDDIEKTAALLKKQLSRAKYTAAGPEGLLRRVAVESGFGKQRVDRAGVSYEMVDWDVVLDRPLTVLISKAADVRKRLEKVPKKGPSNLHGRVFGDPRLSLAERCAWLLRDSRGKKGAPATDDGPVFKLAAMIWTYATGTDAESYNLGNFVKDGAVAVRDIVNNYNAHVRKEGAEGLVNEATGSGPRMLRASILRKI